LSLWPDATEPIAVVTFTVTGHDPGLVAAVLSAEYGIGVRDGRFCTHPLLARKGLAAGLRASIGVGTTEEHIDRLLRALRTYLQHGPQGEYRVVAGRWQPVAEQADLAGALQLLAALRGDGGLGPGDGAVRSVQSVDAAPTAPDEYPPAVQRRDPVVQRHDPAVQRHDPAAQRHDPAVQRHDHERSAAEPARPAPGHERAESDHPSSVPERGHSVPERA